MKKLLIGLAALFVLLSFSGCKTEPEEPSTSELVSVFYTDKDPNSDEYASIWDIPQVTTLEADKLYNLVCVFHQPDFNVKKLQLAYRDKKLDYIINSSNEWDAVYYSGAYWTLASGIDNVPCKFYLVDDEGRKSNAISITITVVAN